jgi:hypothetical protein
MGDTPAIRQIALVEEMLRIHAKCVLPSRVDATQSDLLRRRRSGGQGEECKGGLAAEQSSAFYFTSKAETAHAIFLCQKLGPGRTVLEHIANAGT